VTPEMWIECFKEDARFDGSEIESLVDELLAQFCGPRTMFDARCFAPAEEHERYTVVRRSV
jgi:hypothetical protein